MDTCTQIDYEIIGGIPDHVATVVASGPEGCAAAETITTVSGGQDTKKTTGNQHYAPGEGDPVTGLGKYACHEEAAKINPFQTVTHFQVTVKGVRSPARKSVVVKSGGSVNSCAIIGIGEEGGSAPVTETLTHGECAVDFTLDQATGTVISAKLNPALSKRQCAPGEDPSDQCCSFIPGDVGTLKVTLPGQAEGVPVNFGNGYLESGTASCTTRIIGGRVYTWGSPCPQ